ncbi:MAG: FHA domain-containing protein [Bacteroidota bacterium]
MSNSLRLRYPGLNYFRAEDLPVFFGREEEITRLSSLVLQLPKVLLFGKSGLGKTSLINAGMMPYLVDNNEQLSPENFLYLRFNNFIQKEANSPLETVQNKIREGQNEEGDNPFLKIETYEPNLWLLFKEYIYRKELDKTAPLVVVLDQFEELASYPDYFINEFGEQLAEIYSQFCPTRVRRILDSSYILDPELEGYFISLQLDEFIESPMQVKLLFAIRKDRLDFVKHFQQYIPRLLDELNSFELEPLREKSAQDAIIKPADAQGAFASNSFTFDRDLVDDIVQALAISETDSFIEAYQLQLVCKTIEERVIQTSPQISHITTSFFLEEEHQNTADQIKAILNNHYESQIARLNTDEQNIARDLIEEELISPSGHRRLSRDVDVLEAFVCEAFQKEPGGGDAAEALEKAKALLKTLQDIRLIRAEPNSTGGVNYEISHDTLLAPILRSKDRRLSQEVEYENIIKGAYLLEKEGFRYFRDNRREDAALKFEEALAVLKPYATEVAGQVRMHINLGRALSIYEVDKADFHFKQAFNLASDLADPALMGLVNESLGNFYEEFKDRLGKSAQFKKEDIVAFYQNAIVNYQEVEDHVSIARVYENIGFFQRKQGNFVSAKEIYDAARSHLLITGEFIALNNINRLIEDLEQNIRESQLNVPWGYLRNILNNVIYPLEGAKPIQVGRDASYMHANNISFPYMTISRRHAVLNYDGKTLEDMKSLNGTTINGAVLQYGETYSMQDQDLITLASLIPLQFCEQVPNAPEVPESIWGVCLLKSELNYEYLTETIHYFTLDDDNSLTLASQVVADPVLSLQRVADGVRVLQANGEWSLLSILKEGTNNYKMYKLNTEEVMKEGSPPLRFAQLNDGKITKIGPCLQIVLTSSTKIN